MVQAVRSTATAAVIAVLATACAAVPQERDETAIPAAADTARAAPPINAAILPANTHLTVALDETLSLETVRRGETFTVTVVEPIVAQNRATAIPEGTVITGMVTGVDRSSGPEDLAAIRLNFLRMNLNGVNHPLSASVVRTGLHEPAPGAAEAADTAMVAPRGAVVRGELRIALIAGELGGGAGTIISLGTGAEALTLPAGTQLTIRTFDELDLRR